MSAFGGKADIDQPLPTNLDLWVDALKNPFSHLFLGGAGFWGTGAYTQHEIFAEKIYGLVPRAVGERVAFQDWNRPPRDRKGLLSAREREPARLSGAGLIFASCAPSWGEAPKRSVCHDLLQWCGRDGGAQRNRSCHSRGARRSTSSVGRADRRAGTYNGTCPGLVRSRPHLVAQA